MKTAIAIAAHPDDIEFFMSGTLMRLAEAGYEIHYLNVANGSCGSSEHDATAIVRIRRDEAMRAAHSIGAVYHESITGDLEIFYDKPTLARVASIVREVAPEILLTHSPSDYMEDHTNACRLAVTAAFARGMPNFPVDPPCKPVTGPVTVYHAQPYSHRDPLRRLVEPEIYVDVTDLMQRKTAMLACHVSQQRWLDESQGVSAYLNTMRELDEELGRMSTLFKYAEGWRRHLHLGLCGEKDNPLLAAMKDKAYAVAR